MKGRWKEWCGIVQEQVSAEFTCNWNVLLTLAF